MHPDIKRRVQLLDKYTETVIQLVDLALQDDLSLDDVIVVIHAADDERDLRLIKRLAPSNQQPPDDFGIGDVACLSTSKELVLLVFAEAKILCVGLQESRLAEHVYVMVLAGGGGTVAQVRYRPRGGVFLPYLADAVLRSAEANLAREVSQLVTAGHDHQDIVAFITDLNDPTAIRWLRANLPTEMQPPELANPEPNRSITFFMNKSGASALLENQTKTLIWLMTETCLTGHVKALVLTDGGFYNCQVPYAPTSGPSSDVFLN